MSSKGDAWAFFGDDWPDVADGGFEGADGWLRLGEVADGEDAFWKACGLQLNGGAKSAWKPTVDFYLHVYADSPALPQLDVADTSAAEPFWLGVHPFTGLARLYVSSAKVARRHLSRREPERHPGLVDVPHVTLGFRLRLAADGTYFEVGRP
jgi:hypothetical protein